MSDKPPKCFYTKNIGGLIMVTIKCKECGKEFESEHWKRKFCSLKCRRNDENRRHYAHRGLGSGICTKCNQEFIKKINRKQVLCSDCLQKRFCIECGVEFSTRSRKQQYCPKCYYEEVKKPNNREYIANYKFGTTMCEGCGNEFTRSNRKQYMCSDCRKLYKKPKKVLTIPERLENQDRKLDHRSGYAYIYAPEHPEANTRGYVYEHRVVAEQKIGRRLEKNEVVHHKDEVRSNNDPNNLEVMDRKEHARFHNMGKRMFQAPLT